MSQQTLKVLVPPPVDIPRGALWAAQAALWLARIAFARPAGSGKADASASHRMRLKASS